MPTNPQLPAVTSCKHMLTGQRTHTPLFEAGAALRHVSSSNQSQLMHISKHTAFCVCRPQALPPQVWNSLQDSAGEVLQAMASAVDKAMDQPGIATCVDAPPLPHLSAAGEAGESGGSVTCIAMPVPLGMEASPANGAEVRLRSVVVLLGAEAWVCFRNLVLVWSDDVNGWSGC